MDETASWQCGLEHPRSWDAPEHAKQNRRQMELGVHRLMQGA